MTPSTPAVSTLVSPLGRESVSFLTVPCFSVVSSVVVETSASCPPIVSPELVAAAVALSPPIASSRT